MVMKRTIANISDWLLEKVKLLRDEPFISASEGFVVERSILCGHVEAMLGTIKKTGLDKRISSKWDRRHKLVVVVMADQIIHPCSKLGHVRLMRTTTSCRCFKWFKGRRDQ